MQRLALFGGIVLLAACGNDVADDDDEDFFSDNNSSGGIGQIAEDTGYVADADAPTIISADVYCDYTEC